MAWWRRRRSASVGGGRRQAQGSLDRAATSVDREHLEEFVRTRRGVEAYVEPPTTVTSTTVMLIAHDGEWTRRRVPDAGAAADLARRLGIPIYDARIVGYPQRMRDFNARRKAGGA